MSASDNTIGGGGGGRVARVDASGRPLCLHCGKRLCSRPRGLCHRCYYLPGVHQLYPTKSGSFENPNTPDSNRRRPPPAEPCTALPGTPEKVDALMKRVGLGESLWHPDDARAVDGRIPALDASRAGAPFVHVTCKDSIMICHEGRTQSLADWCREYGAPYNSVYYRVKKGWSLEKALSFKKGQHA